MRATLMHLLETVQIDEELLQSQPFRLPVQWVNRPNLDFRGFAGTITAELFDRENAFVCCPRGAKRPLRGS